MKKKMYHKQHGIGASNKSSPKNYKANTKNSAILQLT